MFKIIIIFLLASILGFLTIWFKKEPGIISIEWNGWLIETSLPILFLCSISIFLFCTVLFILSKRIYILPKTIKYEFIKNKNKNAMISITNAFSAKSMGEIELAKKFSIKAKRLNNSPLKLMLDMDINKFYDEQDNKIFNKMLKYPETKLLGIKNLTNFYFKDNNIAKAIETINLIPKSKKTPSWFFYKLLQLNILNNDWKNVFISINHISKYTNISSKEFKILKGHIYFSKAKYLYNKNNHKESIENVEIALKFIPSFTSGIVLKGKLIYDKNPKEAIEYIKDSWKNYSHPDLARLIYEINSNKNKTYNLKLIKDIIKKRKNNFNNNFLLAKAAIEASSWLTAREALYNIPEKDWTKNIFIMMSIIEKKENGNLKLSDKWFEKAKLANLDFSWGCTACSHIDKEWKIICPKCLNIDSIKWQKYKNNKHSIEPQLHKIENEKITGNNDILTENPENAARGILEDLSKGVNN